MYSVYSVKIAASEAQNFSPLSRVFCKKDKTSVSDTAARFSRFCTRDVSPDLIDSPTPTVICSNSPPPSPLIRYSAKPRKRTPEAFLPAPKDPKKRAAYLTELRKKKSSPYTQYLLRRKAISDLERLAAKERHVSEGDESETSFDSVDFEVLNVRDMLADLMTDQLEARRGFGNERGQEMRRETLHSDGNHGRSRRQQKFARTWHARGAAVFGKPSFFKKMGERRRECMSMRKV